MLRHRDPRTLPAELSFRMVPGIADVACPLLAYHSTALSEAFVMERGGRLGPDDLELMWEFITNQVGCFLFLWLGDQVLTICYSMGVNRRGGGLLAPPESAAVRRVPLRSQARQLCQAEPRRSPGDSCYRSGDVYHTALIFG